MIEKKKLYHYHEPHVMQEVISSYRRTVNIPTPSLRSARKTHHLNNHPLQQAQDEGRREVARLSEKRIAEIGKKESLHGRVM